MNLSPIQLVDAQVLGIKVELAPHEDVVWGATIREVDFSSVRWETSVSFDPLSKFGGVNDGDSRALFVVGLSLRAPVVQAAAPAAFAEESPLPVRLDIKVQGIVRILPNVTEKREELAAANGLALLYGIAREQIASATSRMPGGRITLPTVNFIDDARKLIAKLHAEAGLDVASDRD